MKIWYFTPFSTSGNYGDECNQYCKLVLSDDDYICITDYDFMLLTSNFDKQLKDIIEKYKNDNVGLFTCVTNRSGSLPQCHSQVISEDSDIRNHRKIALQLQREKYDSIKDLGHIISGHLMLFKKKDWASIGGFPDEVTEKMKLKGITKNILSVDNRYSNRALKHGYKVYLMEGVYGIHYYRLNEGIQSKDHLK
jgi:GT2 family glycosyltransferase